MLPHLEKQIFVEKRQRKLPFAMTRSHAHPEYELYYLQDLTGVGKIFIGQHVYPLFKGSLVLIDAKVPHRTDFTKASGHRRYLIELPVEFLGDAVAPLLATTPAFFFHQQTGVYDLTPHQQQQVEEIFETLYNESLFQEENYFQRQLLKVLELLLLVQRFNQQRSLNQPMGVMQIETVQPIVRYVVEHLHEPLSLQTVAEHFFLNKSYLARIFKSYTGQSLADFLNSKRILQAQRFMLNYPHLPLETVATSCGFSSEAQFAKTFKRYTALTPKRFLKKYQTATTPTD
ncbi:helix-turn-helix domain-containing protein [Enterococcus nangangensis]